MHQNFSPEGEPERRGDPVFIVGMPRSGTTLLATLLNAHSTLAIGPETDYFPTVWRDWERRGGPANQDAGAVSMRAFLDSEPVEWMRVDREVLWEKCSRLWRQQRMTHRTLLCTVLQAYAKIQHKSRWGEKTPDHLVYVPAIKQVFADAQILCIVRDPRDVHRSLHSMPWNHGSALNHAIQWYGYQALAHQYQKWYAQSFYVVRYEDLVSAPERTLAEICEWLGIAFEPEMMGRYRTSPTFNLAAEPWKAKALQPIDPGNLFKWKQAGLTPDIRLITRICRRPLREYGYPIPKLPNRLADWLQEFRVAFQALDAKAVGWWMRLVWRMARGMDPVSGRKN